LNVRVEHLESLERQSESNKIELQQRERSLLQAEDRHRANEVKLKKVYGEAIAKLEQVSGFSQDEARRELFHMIEAEARLSSQKTVQKIEEEARQTGKDTAVNILVTAMQRYTADYVSQYSSAVITLPSEDMKGRIIGKEGRNIKALELATGMEFLIGDSQDITISGFNPVRREVARRSLERLISDGRINPTRIEETVGVVEKELDEIIQEEGHATVLEFNLQGIHPDVVTLLGKLYFRTSYTQNVLVHSKEVARFAAMIAEELGLDGSIALRAGLLHDLGKAITAEVEGPHAIIGGDIARRCGEDARIVNAIAAHHEEVPYESIYAPIVIIADMISASRPGARRETLTAYVKRLERLEDIAHSFEGIKRAYALQAGREIRIIVEEEQVGDDQSVILASSIARKIEQEMNFPGQIKVNVIREKRSIAYAK
jgi:ribonuclease Y